jgi:hypothetical protein
LVGIVQGDASARQVTINVSIETVVRHRFRAVFQNKRAPSLQFDPKLVVFAQTATPNVSGKAHMSLDSLQGVVKKAFVAVTVQSRCSFESKTQFKALHSLAERIVQRLLRRACRVAVR